MTIERAPEISSNAAILSNIKRVEVGAEVISPSDLDDDKQRWAGKALIPGIGRERRDLPDVTLARMLLHEYVPFNIEGAGGEDGSASLRVEVSRFPYSIEDQDDFQSFGMRIYPTEGSVLTVSQNDRRTVALNKLSASPEKLDLEMGNGSLHLEIYFGKPEGDLEPITPCTSFREHHKLTG